MSAGLTKQTKVAVLLLLTVACSHAESCDSDISCSIAADVTELLQTRLKVSLREKANQSKSAEEPLGSSSGNSSPVKLPIVESNEPPPGLLDEAVDESAKADAELLAAHGYNFTDDALREEGFEYWWQFARERARRASLLRTGGHWERMSASLHLNYDWGQKEMSDKGAMPTRWIYADFISEKVANHEYYAVLQHRLGYIGYQSKLQDNTNWKYSQFQCSNWDSQAHNAGAKSKITFCGEGVTCKRFGHEGSGWQTHIEAWDLLPKDGARFAFAVNYEDAGNGWNQVTCWFKAPGFKGGKWFKQSTWVGPGGGGGGTTPSSFLEQYGFDKDQTSKIRTGLYGTIWGRDSWGPWKAIERAGSTCEKKVKLGWKKVDWGVKKGPDGQDRWYMSACGCKNTWECPGESACGLHNTGGDGQKSITAPKEMPPTLVEFGTEVEANLPPPPPKPPAPGTNTGTCKWVKHVGKYSGGYAGGVSTSFKTPEEAMKKCIQLGKSTCKAVTCYTNLQGCTVRASALGSYEKETSFTLDDYNCDPAPTAAPVPTTPVLIKSHRGENLQDNNGNLYLTTNAMSWEKWTLVSAGDGKVFIKSHRGENLQDNNGNLYLTTNTGFWEKWTLVSAGDGKVFMLPLHTLRDEVFIKSHRGENLQDDHGNLKLTTNTGFWEKWSFVR